MTRVVVGKDEPKPSRQVRRKIARLAAKIEETAWASDRAFFKDRPARRYRLRPAWTCEIEGGVAALDGTPPPLRPGACWWVAVYQMAPGMRMRVPFQAPHDLDTDPPEDVAREVVMQLTHLHPELEEKWAKLDAAFRGKTP